MGFCLRVIVNEKSLNFEKKTSGVLSVLLLYPCPCLNQIKCIIPRKIEYLLNILFVYYGREASFTWFLSFPIQVSLLIFRNKAKHIPVILPSFLYFINKNKSWYRVRIAQPGYVNLFQYFFSYFWEQYWPMALNIKIKAM